MTTQSVATFAAGCFWGVELAFQRVPGVLSTTVGYAQGHQENATYKQVCSGKTGHAETIKIVFDPSEVTYEQLLDKFWSIHDPTTLNRQKEDVGTQYRSGIYYQDDEQKALAIASKEAQQQKTEKEIVTEIEEFRVFWDAEAYHQQYLEKGGQCADKGSDVPIKCYG